MPPRSKKTTVSHPSKRRKASTAQPMSPIFISQDAQTRYTSSLARRKCIPERGIVDPLHSVQRLIELRNWGMLVQQPEAALVPVVREFYANVPEHRNMRAWVRGQWVPFDSETINKFYQLPDFEHDGMNQLQEEGVDYEEVLRIIAHDGVEWVMSKNEPKSIPRAGLTKPSKIWHYFIAAKLLPSMHLAGITRDRALLNYAIQMDYTIDIGKIIEASILATARLSTPTGGFGHPSLIYALCLQAGIPTGGSEEFVHPQLAISPDLVRTFKGPPPTSRGAGTSSAPASSSRQRSQSSSVPASDSTSDMFRQLTRRFDRMVTCQERMIERHDMQYDHMMQCYSTLAAEVSTRSGAPVQFPPAPSFPPYPPDDDDDDGADVAAEESEEAADGDSAEEDDDDDDDDAEDGDDAE